MVGPTDPHPGQHAAESIVKVWEGLGQAVGPTTGWHRDSFQHCRGVVVGLFRREPHAYLILLSTGGILLSSCHIPFGLSVYRFYLQFSVQRTTVELHWSTKLQPDCLVLCLGIQGENENFRYSAHRSGNSLEGGDFGAQTKGKPPGVGGNQ